jgi:hypothetical protein
MREELTGLFVGLSANPVVGGGNAVATLGRLERLALARGDAAGNRRVESAASPRDHGAMIALAITGTVYSTFCAFLVFPHLGAPKLLSRAAISLCGAQLVAAVGWSVTHQHCGGMTSGDAVFNKPCPTITAVFAGAIPILTGVFFVASVAYGLLAVRRWSAQSRSTMRDVGPA